MENNPRYLGNRMTQEEFKKFVEEENIKYAKEKQEQKIIKKVEEYIERKSW